MDKEYLEETAAYLCKNRKDRILNELYFNAYRTLRSVYIFKFYDEYVVQLKSDKNEDKRDVYWNASYYEKLIDYVKISIAFENYNKAVLLENGFLVHKVKKSPTNKEIFKRQNEGIPILVTEFLQFSNEQLDRHSKKVFLTGLTPNFETINYSLTLSKKYQEIIKLDNELCYRLKEINDNRNRLHFYTDFKGAFEVNSHLKKWLFLKEKSLEIIEHAYNRINEKE